MGELSETTQLKLTIEQQNDAIEVLKRMLKEAQDENRALKQDNDRLTFLYESEKAEHTKLKKQIINQKGE